MLFGGRQRAVEKVNNYNGNSRSRSEYNGEKSSEKHKGIGYDLGLLDRYTDPKGGSKTIFHTHILRIGLAYSF